MEGHMTQEDYSGYQFDLEEDEGSLSDLDEDINQYIATTSEVEFYPPPHTHTAGMSTNTEMFPCCLPVVVIVHRWSRN